MTDHDEITEWCKLHEEVLKDIRTEAYRSGYHDGEIVGSNSEGDVDWVRIKFFEWISTNISSPSIYACDKKWEELRKISFFAEDRNNILQRIVELRRERNSGCDKKCDICQDNYTCPESTK